LTAPIGLDDGVPTTVWAEGLGGDGRGEFLTGRATAGRYRIRGFRIVPGDASTPAAFKSSNRLKTLALALGPEPQRRFEVEFPEDPAAADGKSRAAYWIALPTPIESACVTVAIRDVYRGTDAGAASGGRTAISDLEVFTELDDASGIDRLIADIAAGPDCPSRVPLLVALGEPAVLPAAQTILGASGVGRECLVEALARIDATVKSGVALDALVAALIGATAVEEQLIIRTLGKADAPPVHAVADLLLSPKARPVDRARAAHVLGDLGGADAPAALVAAAGTNDPDVRLAIVQALDKTPGANVSTLVAAIDEARRGTGDVATRREADFVRALPALAGRAPANRLVAIEALRGSLAAGRPFEIRARAIMAMGAVGDPTLVVDLVGVRDHADDPVLRYLAVRELGGIAGPGAAEAMRAALKDGDPRVRETAAEGLGITRNHASEPALIQAAKDEPWPFARRAQIEALSHLCGAPGRDLLVRAIERDVDEVRRAALAGLVRCGDPRSRPVVLSTLKDRRSSATLRELAANLVDEIGDRSDANALAEILVSLVNEAEADLAIEGVAVSALRSLGHLGGPQAARVAARLAVDGSHPYRQAAIEALGQICDGDIGAKALTRLRSDPDTGLAATAQASEQDCKIPVASRPKRR
jgi:HEAT repeat protein